MGFGKDELNLNGIYGWIDEDGLLRKKIFECGSGNVVSVG